MNENHKAILRYAHTAPSASQTEKIKQVLIDRIGVQNIEIELLEDPSIGGGFIVSCGNFEYDWSDKGRARQLRTDLNNESFEDTKDARAIISMLKEKVDDFELSIKDREVGEVTWVGDGIANVDGIEHAFYGEIIEFEDGTKGMAQDIRDDHIGCILFGDDTGIRQGTRAVRTYKEAGVPVGNAFIGRVINALGEPVDGKGDIKVSGYRPVETAAPGIIDREPVNEPMETGILSIDTMFPIGRG
ncbi:MAG: F0F1 ATP synthase subunit delta, partial [Butyrivibrio sp.]|nr:F0F1 ATP synthase subunit delta [Butyrivibrio sp.]